MINLRPKVPAVGIRDYLGSQGLLGCTMAGRGGVNLDVSADRDSQAGVIFFAGG